MTNHPETFRLYDLARIHGIKWVSLHHGITAMSLYQRFRRVGLRLRATTDRKKRAVAAPTDQEEEAEHWALGG